MKKDTHPQYFSDAKIICNCKNVIHAGSTKEEQTVEVCSACHPFYTGKTKLIDTAGRVNRFKERMEKAAKAKAAKKSDAKAPAEEEEKVAEEASA